MRSVIGLKNILIFSVILFTIGSVSAQQAFAGLLCDCESQGNGDWDSVFDCGLGIAVPLSSENVCIVDNDNVQLDGVGLANNFGIIDGSLFIGCDGDLTTDGIEILSLGLLINHGSVIAPIVFNFGLIQNSSSAFTVDSIVDFGQGIFENIPTICDRPIGGTSIPVSTTSLLVAGFQANMGLWSLALVGIVGAGAAIIYKTKSKKTEQ